MLIARFHDGLTTRIGVVEDDQIRPIMLAGQDNESRLERLGVAAVHSFAEHPGNLPFGSPLSLAGVRLLKPVPRPDKIICIGVNYRAHAAESQANLPSVPEVFAKFANSLQDPGEPIDLSQEDSKVDYEGELCVVIGRRAKHLDKGNALSAVAGYTIANDVTARTWQSRGSQWVMGKSFDTFCPIGPWMVTSDSIDDPQSMAIETRVNGTLRQEASTRDMVFGVTDILVFLTRVLTLEPGDLILTGTPAGIGHSHVPPQYLNNGDEVAITVAGIGTLINPIRSGA